MPGGGHWWGGWRRAEGRAQPGHARQTPLYVQSPPRPHTEVLPPRFTFLLVKVKREEWEGCWPRSLDLVPTMGFAARGRQLEGAVMSPTPSSLASPGASDLA